ncbi:MAG: hypothetical protein IKJ91_00655 [Clostridia bacterium]|nr:hypothetical protein [Clostridia bacterium]
MNIFFSTIFKVIFILFFIVLVFSFIYLALFSVSVKKLSIENIDAIDIEDIVEYVHSDNLSFSRVENILFIPEIKPISYEEYVIYLSSYSNNYYDQINIIGLELFHGEKVLFSNYDSKNMTVIKNGNIYEWNMSGMFFPFNVELFEDGTNLSLKVKVCVVNNNNESVKELCYNIIVKEYTTLIVK